MARTAEVQIAELIKPATMVTRNMKISEAIHHMKSEGVDFLSVVDERHNLIGAVSEANLIRLVKHEPPTPMGDATWFDSVDHEAGKQTIEAIMTTNITTISPHDSVATALKVMDSIGYKLLHVVDPSTGRLLGVVRIVDIFKKLLGV